MCRNHFCESEICVFQSETNFKKNVTKKNVIDKRTLKTKSEQ